MLITIQEASKMVGICPSMIYTLILDRKIFPAKRSPNASCYSGEKKILLESEDVQDWRDLMTTKEEPESEIADRNLKHICERYAPDKDIDLVESLIRRKSSRIYRWLNRRVFAEGTFEDSCKMIRLKYFFKITGGSFDDN